VFPAIIPPPFFNSLIATVYSYRATAPPLAENDVKWPGTCCQRPQYFANEIVEWIRVDRVGCVDCGTLRGDADEMASQQSLYHCVLIELSAQTRVIQVSCTSHSSPVHTGDKAEFNTVDFFDLSTVSLWPRTH